MSGSKTATANWKTQYKLTIATNFGTTSPSVGVYWENAGTVVNISATPPGAGAGENYVFNGWIGTGSGSYTGSNQSTSVTMNGAITENASWTHRYTLTMATNVGTTSPSVGVYWENAGTVVNISATPPGAGAGENYVWNGWTGTGTGSYTGTSNPATNAVTMNGPITETASWTKTAYGVYQYYLTVTSLYGTTGGDGWYDSGDNAYATVTPLTVAGSTGVQYVFTNWSVDATGTTSPSDPINMDGPKTATAVWKTQFKLTMATNFGTTSPSAGDHWYDVGTVVDISATAPAAGAGEQYVWNGWTGTGTISYTGTDNPADDEVTMNGAITETASWTYQYTPTMAPNSPSPSWTRQYYLTVTSLYGTKGGEGWYNNGDITQATVDPLTVDGENGVQYVFTHWSDNALGITSPSDPINMDSPKTATANWFRIENKDYVSEWDNYGIGFAGAGAHVNANFDNVYVENIDFDVKENIKNAQIIVLQLVNRPSCISMGPADNPYGYLEVILINLNENDFENIVLTFKVEKSWISANSIDENAMTLNRWNENDNTWTSYSATKIGEDSTYSYFSVNLPHLSTFVIGGSRLSVVAPPTVVPTVVSLSTSAIFLIAVAVIGGLLGGIAVRSRRRRRQRRDGLVVPGFATKLQFFTDFRSRNGF
jgi:PGF-pre-PGF domain-containing protein